MGQRQHRFILAGLTLVTGMAFAACSGLDDRKVTRGSEVAAGGGDGGSDASPGEGGEAPSVGGSDGSGAEGPSNPFGGDTFTGGAPPVVDGPPEVVKVDPDAGEEDVGPSVDISLLFSEGLASESVTTDSIQVVDGNRPIDGAVSYEGLVATFSPSSRLSLLASYEVNVSTEVTDASGQALKQAFTSKFRVRDGVWGRQGSVIEDQTGWNGGQASATDAHGNVLVVYTRRLEPTSRVYTAAARWIKSAAGLGPEVPLETNGLDCSGVDVAVDADGNAVVIWQTVDAESHATLRARRYVGGEWERQPQDVAQDGATAPMQSADSRSVAIGSGQVVVAWTRYFNQASVPYYVIEYTSTALDGAWPTTPASPLSVTNNSPKYEYLDNAHATLDAKGVALVTFVYHSSTGAYAGLYFSRRTPGKEWEYPLKVPASTVPGFGSGPAVASDGDGAMAVWADYDAQSVYRLRASRYTRAKQWAEPIEIGDAGLTSSINLRASGGLVGDARGFWLTWTQSLGNARNVYVKRYDIEKNAWDSMATLVSDGVARTESAAVGVDGHGNALVAFDSDGQDGALLVMGSRYVFSSGRWLEPTPLTAAGTYFRAPLLTVSENGVASVLFSSTANEGMPAAENLGGLYRIFK